MSQSPQPFPISVPVADLEAAAQGWIVDCQYRRLADQTVSGRRIVTDKLLWWLAREGRDACGPTDLKRFLSYVSAAQPQGRWGNPYETATNRAGTTATYHARLLAFFRWSVHEGCLDANPMDRVQAPVNRPDQIQPFTKGQLDALLKAARASDHGRRDEALLLYMLDTLCRATEVCSVRVGDCDIAGRQARVHGKGGKDRTVYWSPATAKVLWRYLSARRAESADPLFASEQGGALTRSGLLQIFRRLGIGANLTGVRCSPHTVRHTGAVMLVRSGASPFALQALLGHTDLKMTRRYVALAEADVQHQHAQYSPVESWKRGSR